MMMLPLMFMKMFPENRCKHSTCIFEYALIFTSNHNRTAKKKHKREMNKVKSRKCKIKLLMGKKNENKAINKSQNTHMHNYLNLRYK